MVTQIQEEHDDDYEEELFCAARGEEESEKESINSAEGNLSFLCDSFALGLFFQRKTTADRQIRSHPGGGRWGGEERKKEPPLMCA